MDQKVGDRSSRAQILAAVVVTAFVAHALGVLGDGTPTLRSPYPVILTLLAFLGIPPILLALCVGALFYLSTRRAAISVDPGFDWRARLALLLSILASAANFIVGWDYGIRYQGKTFVVSCICISAVAVVSLCSIFAANLRRPKAYLALLYYFVLFVWLGTYALPYLGEGP
jgi:hypothetical protein